MEARSLHALTKKAMAPRDDEDDELSKLIADLSDTARQARAQRQLFELVAAGGAKVVLRLLLDRLLGQEGVRGAGGRRAVAKLLEEAMRVAGVDGLAALPRLVAVSAQALGDNEATVRDSFAMALGSAARSAAGSATGKELLTLLIRPLLKLLEARTAPLQQGGAQATREVVRALQPAQLRPSASTLLSALQRHLQASGTHHGRPALLESAAALMLAMPDLCMAHDMDLLCALQMASAPWDFLASRLRPSHPVAARLRPSHPACDHSTHAAVLGSRPATAALSRRRALSAPTGMSGSRR